MNRTGPTFTLADIAHTARVERAVVSTWIKRQTVRGEVIPFPTPVSRVGGVNRYDRDEVIAYLRRTGRGNNPDFALDAPAGASPTRTGHEALRLLLDLRLLADQELTGLEHTDLVALAEDADPQDECLLGEICGLEGVLPEDLEYVDDLFEASLGPGDALDRFAASFTARAARVREVSQTVVNLLAELCAGIGVAASAPVQVAGSRLALRVAIAASDALGGLRPEGTQPSDRAVRREAMARDLLANEEDASVVRVESVLGLSNMSALTATDDLQLELAPGDFGLVLGPALLLCDDHLPRDLSAVRADVIRKGCVRAAIRLRHGHNGEAPRQALGVWVLQGGFQDGPVALADLSARPVETLDTADLATDVLAALTDDARRKFRYLRMVPRPRFLGQRAVVPPGVIARVLGRGGASRHLERVNELTLSMDTPIPPYDVTVARAAGSVVVRSQTLAELVAARRLIMKRGARLDLSFASPEGTVRLLDPLPDGSPHRFDPLELEEHFPRAVRTEPGDVVYVTEPAPRAVVDSQGGSLVAPPARILRLVSTGEAENTDEAPTSSKVGSQLLAAAINRQPESAKDWRAWRVPALPADESDALERELARIAAARNALRARLDGLESLLNALIDGVAEGALSLIPPLGSE